MARLNAVRSHHDRVKSACSWQEAHATLTRLARERALADAEEGRWLLIAWRSGVHLHVGCGSFGEYAERLFGYRPRTTHEKLRVAEALEALPGLSQALESGAMSWCAARELSRVATIETETVWLEAARGKTTRDLEELVAGKRPGDMPEAIVPSSSHRQLLRFEVAPETFASFREAMQRLRRDAGGTLDDDGILLSMARQILGGPRDEGRSSSRFRSRFAPRAGAALKWPTARSFRSALRSWPWQIVTPNISVIGYRARPTRTEVNSLIHP